MDRASRTWGDFTFTFVEPAGLRALENTVFKYVMHEPVLRGFAGWEMCQNAPGPEVEAPDLAATDLEVEAVAEGLVLGYGTPGP